MEIKDNEVRSIAEQQSHDRHSPEFGLYARLDPAITATVNPSLAERCIHSWSLAEVEEWLAAREEVEH